MKSIKRMLALLLAMVMLFGVAVSANASLIDVLTDSEKNPLENVATMYLCVSNANPKLPHMWIYIINDSEENLDIVGYKLKPGKALSMGAFKDRGAGFGIHFNLERYWVKEETYSRTFCMSTRVNRLELDQVNSAIRRHNYWNWVFNCAWFATSMWNICSPRKVPYLFAPQIERVIMLLYGAHRPDLTFDKLYDEDDVYKYTSDGLQTVPYRVIPTNTGV